MCQGSCLVQSGITPEKLAAKTKIAGTVVSVVINLDTAAFIVVIYL